MVLLEWLHNLLLASGIDSGPEVEVLETLRAKDGAAADNRGRELYSPQ